MLYFQSTSQLVSCSQTLYLKKQVKGLATCDYQSVRCLKLHGQHDTWAAWSGGGGGGGGGGISGLEEDRYIFCQNLLAQHPHSLLCTRIANQEELGQIDA